MRILLVSSSSGSRGGGEIFLLYLAEALKAAGHTVGLWTARHSRMDVLAERFAAIGDVVRADYRNTYDTWHRGLFVDRSSATLGRLRASWRAWQPDVIHFNKQNLEDGLDLLAAAASLSCPHLCTIHITQSARFLGARFGGWRDANARRALRAYRAPLVVVAPARAVELRSVVGSTADVRTVLNGVPPGVTSSTSRAALRDAEGLAPDALAVVAVGRLEAQKCPLRFLDYADRIRRTVPEAQFRWIGSGRLTSEWEQAVAQKDLGASVRRINWRDDVRGVLPAYDLLLHPAAYEGLSLALLEAMDAGLPCAVTPAVHAQLPPTLQACSLQLVDEVDWADLLRERTKLAALGTKAQAVVRRDFSTAAMARGYEALYTELCRKP
jgi:glycosyltransferase involved in cell wall biosynthesis